MPVVLLQLKYISPIRHGENIVVESFCAPLRKVRWIWNSTFLRDGIDKVAEARVEIVLVRKVDSEFQLVRNPPEPISVFLSNL